MATRKLKNDLTGKQFVRLSVIRRAVRDNNRRVFWVCKCECGKTTEVRSDALTDGKTTSCGCLSVERSTTHGMRNTIVYRKWVGMRQRCNDPNVPNYCNYGGRGIKVCERWNSFENFLEDMGLPPTGKHQPDRIDNDGDYRTGNVRWVLPKVNANNRRTNVHLTLNGKTLTISEWSDQLDIGVRTIQYRKSVGWSDLDTLTKPVDKSKASKKKTE